MFGAEAGGESHIRRLNHRDPHPAEPSGAWPWSLKSPEEETDCMARQRRRQMSVLFIPDDGSRTVVFKLGYWPLRAVAGTILLLLILLILEFAFIWKIQEWRQSAHALRAENSRLNEEVARVEELALTLKRIQGTDQKLRQMLLHDAGPTQASFTNAISTGRREENGKKDAPVASAVGGADGSPRDSVKSR